MDRRIAVWFAIAGLTAAWGLFAFVSGDGGVLPGLLSAVALGCAVDAGLRDRITGKILWAFSGSGIRAGVILIAAVMLWQLVGVELALLVAGDVLVYVEALVAVSLMAVNVRLKPLKEAVRRRWRVMTDGLAMRRRAMARAIRWVRPVRKTPPADDTGPGWVFVRLTADGLSRRSG